MNKQNNRINILYEKYRLLDNDSKLIFRWKFAKLCSIRGEKTIYAKLKPGYNPSPIEELAAKMIVDEITTQN